ncbi:hypothetical protein E2C01_086716 [Portunus trituberculatus]|uniref:Uncharacterized protein n=1 Tax=Portunus trituberculatus TaxID=210409 RepID=A0A5B7JBA7_PORTR|nr:hypothetical protein [Portunus trituberculatus]
MVKNEEEKEENEKEE